MSNEDKAPLRDLEDNYSFSMFVYYALTELTLISLHKNLLEKSTQCVLFNPSHHRQVMENLSKEFDCDYKLDSYIKKYNTKLTLVRKAILTAMDDIHKIIMLKQTPLKEKEIYNLLLNMDTSYFSDNYKPIIYCINEMLTETNRKGYFTLKPNGVHLLDHLKEHDIYNVTRYNMVESARRHLGIDVEGERTTYRSNDK